MTINITYSTRLGQSVNTTWDKFHPRYLSDATKRKRDRIYKELCETGKSKLSDEDGTLYIEVVK